MKSEIPTPPPSPRRFHVEQDARYVPILINEGAKWSNCDRKPLPSWSIYESVGSPAYQTPIITGLSEKQAKTKFQELIRTHA